VASKCLLILIINEKVISVLSTPNSPPNILSIFVVSIPIMVLLIIRIKMCLAKMIRLLLSIKKIP
jgi:hypothetical protein